MVTVECKSCGAPVVWAVTVNGKRMPVDAVAVDGGSIELVDALTGVEARVVPLVDRAGRGDLRASHFATCQFAASHRRAR